MSATEKPARRRSRRQHEQLELEPSVAEAEQFILSFLDFDSPKRSVRRSRRLAAACESSQNGCVDTGALEAGLDHLEKQLLDSLATSHKAFACLHCLQAHPVPKIATLCARLTNQWIRQLSQSLNAAISAAITTAPTDDVLAPDTIPVETKKSKRSTRRAKEEGDDNVSAVNHKRPRGSKVEPQHTDTPARKKIRAQVDQDGSPTSWENDVEAGSVTSRRPSTSEDPGSCNAERLDSLFRETSVQHRQTVIQRLSPVFIPCGKPSPNSESIPEAQNSPMELNDAGVQEHPTPDFPEDSSSSECKNQPSNLQQPPCTFLPSVSLSVNSPPISTDGSNDPQSHLASVVKDPAVAVPTGDPPKSKSIPAPSVAKPSKSNGVPNLGLLTLRQRHAAACRLIPQFNPLFSPPDSPQSQPNEAIDKELTQIINPPSQNTQALSEVNCESTKTSTSSGSKEHPNSCKTNMHIPAFRPRLNSGSLNDLPATASSNPDNRNCAAAADLAADNQHFLSAVAEKLQVPAGAPSLVNSESVLPGVRLPGQSRCMLSVDMVETAPAAPVQVVESMEDIPAVIDSSRILREFLAAAPFRNHEDSSPSQLFPPAHLERPRSFSASLPEAPSSANISNPPTPRSYRRTSDVSEHLQSISRRRDTLGSSVASNSIYSGSHRKRAGLVLSLSSDQQSPVWIDLETPTNSAKGSPAPQGTPTSPELTKKGSSRISREQESTKPEKERNRKRAAKASTVELQESTRRLENTEVSSNRSRQRHEVKQSSTFHRSNEHRKENRNGRLPETKKRIDRSGRGRPTERPRDKYEDLRRPERNFSEMSRKSHDTWNSGDAWWLKPPPSKKRLKGPPLTERELEELEKVTQEAPNPLLNEPVIATPLPRTTRKSKRNVETFPVVRNRPRHPLPLVQQPTAATDSNCSPLQCTETPSFHTPASSKSDSNSPVRMADHAAKICNSRSQKDTPSPLHADTSNLKQPSLDVESPEAGKSVNSDSNSSAQQFTKTTSNFETNNRSDSDSSVRMDPMKTSKASDLRPVFRPVTVSTKVENKKIEGKMDCPLHGLTKTCGSAPAASWPKAFQTPQVLKIANCLKCRSIAQRFVALAPSHSCSVEGIEITPAGAGNQRGPAEIRTRLLCGRGHSFFASTAVLDAAVWCPVCIHQADLKTERSASIKKLVDEDADAQRNQQKLFAEAQRRFNSVSHESHASGAPPCLKRRMASQGSAVSRSSSSCSTPGGHIDQSIMRMAARDASQYEGVTVDHAIPVLQIMQGGTNPWRVLQMETPNFWNGSRSKIAQHPAASEAFSNAKAAYKNLARKIHPDKNPHPKATEVFLILDNAWRAIVEKAS